jgi:type VI protein secretion system component VasF
MAMKRTREWEAEFERELERRWQERLRSQRPRGYRYATIWLVSGLMFMGWMAWLVFQSN